MLKISKSVLVLRRVPSVTLALSELLILHSAIAAILTRLCTRSPAITWVKVCLGASGILCNPPVRFQSEKSDTRAPILP